MRRTAEKLKYRDISAVHELPPIFHYWSNRYVLPILREAGYDGVDDFFVQHIARFRDKPLLRVVSIGSGNCEQDLRLVRTLLDMGVTNLRYECLEFNDAMLARARAEAHRLAVAQTMLFSEIDLAQWRPQTQYEVVLASQFLHHVPGLEVLFDTIRDALTDDGLFLVDDMIGRNGHMRWPEALELVNALWSELDDAHKFNHLHGITNRRFVNWDCSLTGFEGIRAQDILPLLMERFGFESFIVFANLIDVFVERPYGPNFDVNNPADLAFIDKVQALDQANIESGRIKPTHMIAALCKAAPARTTTIRHLTPQFCLRSPLSNL
ncbi:MAG TPA: class I SAM-dependent methyltransferase [Candidatus Acidoferrum sp.]|nr:class I SAM-dependent methyltransferase [Candidatus Acidoferrum sp.]